MATARYLGVDLAWREGRAANCNTLIRRLG